MKTKNIIKVIKTNKITLITLVVFALLISISIYVSFAFYTDKSTMNLINGSVGYFENPDLNINFMVQDRDSTGNALNTYSAIWTAPSYNYVYNSSKSYCTNGATFIKGEDNYFSVESTEKSKCYFYYDAASDVISSDITLILMRKEPSAENADANGYILANEYSLYGLYNLGLGYNFSLSNCEEKSASISYNLNSNTLDITTDIPTICTVYFDAENYIEAKPLLYDEILLNEGNYDSVDVAKNFIESKKYVYGTAITEDVGLYSTIDQTGNNSYFFAGNSQNNYVEFAGYNWRIVRIDGDGNIKLIYSEEIDIKNKFNDSNNSTIYTGYHYDEEKLMGNTNDSDIKKFLEDWYNENFVGTTAEQSIETTYYCIDRVAYKRSGLATNYQWTLLLETELTSAHYYNAYKRLYSDNEPSIECESNDYIESKIGLISVDEAAFVIGTTEYNKSHYLYTGASFWTITPSNYTSSKANVFVVVVNGNIGISSSYSDASTVAIRPTISLKSSVGVQSGNGIIEDPYVIS